MGFFPLTSVAVGLSSKRWSNTFFTVLLLCYLVFYKTWVCFFSLQDKSLICNLFAVSNGSNHNSFKMTAKSQSQ